MLNNKIKEQIENINKKLEHCKNDLDLFNVLRTEQNVILSMLEDKVVLEYGRTQYIVSKKNYKVKNITYYNEDLKTFENVEI